VQCYLVNKDSNSYFAKFCSQTDFYVRVLQVAAGMKSDLRLELYAIAVGVEGETGVGTISHPLEIVTETDVLCVPIQANILFTL